MRAGNVTRAQYHANDVMRSNIILNCGSAPMRLGTHVACVIRSANETHPNDEVVTRGTTISLALISVPLIIRNCLRSDGCTQRYSHNLFAVSDHNITWLLRQHHHGRVVRLRKLVL